MEVQKLKGGVFKLAQDLSAQPRQPRPPGLHQGDIIDDLMMHLDPGRYAKKGPDGELLPMDTVKVESGQAFERALEMAFKPASPGSFRPDPIWVPIAGATGGFFTGDDKHTRQWVTVPGTPGGIWCSPDNLDPDCQIDGDLTVREFKLTWYSQKKECPHDAVYWPWLVQIKGYCYAVKTPYAVLTVMHVNGDYAPPTPMPPDNYGLIFTALELMENWAMLVNHAKQKGWL